MCFEMRRCTGEFLYLGRKCVKSSEQLSGYRTINIYTFTFKPFLLYCSAAVEGYLLNIKKEKWGDKLEMAATAFNKWDAGEPSSDCGFGKWGASVPVGDLHLWGTSPCNEASYLTLCQDMLGE
jgi:hypothetical protein